MKRTAMVGLILVLLLTSVWPNAGAQGPLGDFQEPIDDLTPRAFQPEGRVDKSDEQRIPEAYMQATGGPDLFGYTYADSDEGGCTYAWIDGEFSEAIPGLDGEDAVAILPIGFAFPFYGETYTQLVVDTNGALMLEGDASEWSNRPLGGAGPSPRLAPFWDDLRVDAVHAQMLGAAPKQVLVISYEAKRSPEGNLRFQVLLGEDGRIVFQYETLSSGLGDGSSATIGIQGPETGLGYLFNGYPEENTLHEGLAVCFEPPDGIYLSPGFQQGHGLAGSEIRYIVSAINQTDAPGTFGFSAMSQWATMVTPQSAYLEQGEVLDLAITVKVPAGAAGEQVETVVKMLGVGAEHVGTQTIARLETIRTSGDHGYTGASYSDEVAIFDLQTWALFDRLSLLPEGDYPYDATMKPDGSEVWIPGASGDGVVVIDTGTDQITHRIPVGEYAIGVAFRKDEAYAFVSARDSENVTVVDTGTYLVVDTIPLPTYYLGAGNLALNPQSGDIYVVDWYDDHLFVLDSEAFTVIQEVQLGSSLWQLVVNPLGDRLYVTDRGQDVVHVLNTATLTEAATIPVGDDPWGIDITPDGSLIYVTNEDSHNITVIDATDNSVITTITLPHDDADPRDVDFSSTGAHAYVTSGAVDGDDVVYVIETATHSVVGQANVAPASNPNVVAVAPQTAAALVLIADKYAAPEPVVVGDPLTYTVSFGYNGLTPATNVAVTDTLPVGTGYLTSSGGLTSTYNITDHEVIWELGSVDPSTAGALTVLVLPVDEALAGQVITNEAYLDFTSFGNFSATVSATSTVLAPEMSIGYPDGGEPVDPLLLCEGGHEVTMAALSNRSDPLVYSWDLGDGTLSSAPVVTHAWTYGDYTVLLSTTNAYGWVETDTLALEVGHEPQAGFLSNSPVVLGENAVLTDLTIYDPAEWSWDFGDGVGTSEEQHPIYNYSNPGIYTITLTVTNRCGMDVFADRFEVWETAQFHHVYLPVVIGGGP